MNTRNTLLKMMGKTRRNQMFGKRQNNKSLMWTLLGIGAGAAAYKMKRNRNVHLSRTVQNVMDTMQNGNLTRNMSSAMAEFSQELMPKQNGQK